MPSFDVSVCNVPSRRISFEFSEVILPGGLGGRRGENPGGTLNFSSLTLRTSDNRAVEKAAQWFIERATADTIIDQGFRVIRLSAAEPTSIDQSSFGGNSITLTFARIEVVIKAS